ncbi:hypothetical protein RE6C_04469 [Rhodopirellula europaea 6C]|uniref:Uncharacterized protein n=1 Tax=Rhodopirellula europaea 6C TaxID=1263867 RepID=M2APJ4_9BACT|nr:hypothetical protein RE6C_04469 [Rhodopirellula europaea 6C]
MHSNTHTRFVADVSSDPNLRLQRKKLFVNCCPTTIIEPVLNA